MHRLIVIVLATLNVFAQTPPDDLNGADLRQWLKQNFYDGNHEPDGELGYKESRRQMYNIIDNKNDTVFCVYGGFAQRVIAGGDVTNPGSINAEHTIPQSFFGRSEPMRSDLHHLFPTFKQFNSNRSNFPFGEIEDSDTERWMRNSSTFSSVPQNDIDAFSEGLSRSGRMFEPKEDHKGNVARAVFYFYTMYPNFELRRVGDINTFYAWHLADRVDDVEQARNDAIAQFQGNRNPYIDQPNLVIRAWDQIDMDAVRSILTKMGREDALNTDEPDPDDDQPTDDEVDEDDREIRFFSLSPSPYTSRHDAMRAGFGIYLLLDQLIKDEELALELAFYDGGAFYEDKDKIKTVLSEGDLFVFGSSTWAQGPTIYTRKFFELAGQNLMGVKATAWATSGGAHTGGEEVVHSFLRSLMGMGAEVFTVGQKYMVFTTDERLEPEAGSFTLFDLWYMDQFARHIAAHALSENRAQTQTLAERLGASPFYYLDSFPPSEVELAKYTDLQTRINQAKNPNSEAWKGLEALLTTVE